MISLLTLTVAEQIAPYFEERNGLQAIVTYYTRETFQMHNVEKMGLDWISLFTLAASSEEGKQQYYKCGFIVLLLLGGWRIWSQHLPRLLVNEKEYHSRLGGNPISPVIIKTHYLWAMIASSLKR